MAARTFVITGTDTGVGKTVLTALLARYLRDAGSRVVALKPICSGGRDDARTLHNAIGGALSLDQINPWHFRAPIAPLLAARLERRRVRLTGVLGHLRKLGAGCEVLLVEGAGGLLTPLGENFNLLDLITALRAVPIVVAPNRLGAVNQVLLVMAALPGAAARRAQIVLVAQDQPDEASRTNGPLLVERIRGERVYRLPRLKDLPNSLDGPFNAAVRRMLKAILWRAR